MITKESVNLAVQNQLSLLIRKKAAFFKKNEHEIWLKIEKNAQGLRLQVRSKTELLESLSGDEVAAQFDIPFYLKMFHIEREVKRTISNILLQKQAKFLLFSLEKRLFFADGKYHNLATDDFEKAYDTH